MLCENLTFLQNIGEIFYVKLVTEFFLDLDFGRKKVAAIVIAKDKAEGKQIIKEAMPGT